MATEKNKMKRLGLILLFASLSIFLSISALAGSFKGINYAIIEKSKMGSIKISIDIRLQEKVSKDFLRELALKFQKEEPKKYDRMFITYYLLGMTPGAGAWATSHFNPNLEVKILGTTIEEEKTLISKSKNPCGKIIGEWLDESPYVRAKYTFVKRDGKILVILKFESGSGSEKEMIQREQSGRLRFEEKVGNSFGEYYLIEVNGQLGIYDNAGLIKTLHSVK
jgi:hypothetical protein